MLRKITALSLQVLSNVYKIPCATHLHSQTTIAIHITCLRIEFSRENFNSVDLKNTTQHLSASVSKLAVTHSVDFPAPLAPTMAMRESRPTSILTFLRIIFPSVYPNVTSDICNRGGEIFSVSGNLKIKTSSNFPTIMRRSHPLEFFRFFRLWRL
jgi:hypothetical protein